MVLERRGQKQQRLWHSQLHNLERNDDETLADGKVLVPFQYQMLAFLLHDVQSGKGAR